MIIPEVEMINLFTIELSLRKYVISILCSLCTRSNHSGKVFAQYGDRLSTAGNWINSTTQDLFSQRHSLCTAVVSTLLFQNKFLPSATKLRRLCFYRCLSVHGGVCLSACWDTTPPPGADPPPRDGYCCGRYASYWNAFLLKYFYFCLFFRRCWPKAIVNRESRL